MSTLAGDLITTPPLSCTLYFSHTHSRIPCYPHTHSQSPIHPFHTPSLPPPHDILNWQWTTITSHTHNYSTVPSYYSPPTPIHSFIHFPFPLLLQWSTIISLGYCMDRRRVTRRELRSGAFYAWPMLYGWVYPQVTTSRHQHQYHHQQPLIIKTNTNTNTNTLSTLTFTLPNTSLISIFRIHNKIKLAARIRC